eukprot:m.137673 g.137673  ORF g.137673 m.137673 type:complete len:751 (+) comp17003_c0_seq1:181-2433(+)
MELAGGHGGGGTAALGDHQQQHQHVGEGGNALDVGDFGSDFDGESGDDVDIEFDFDVGSVDVVDPAAAGAVSWEELRRNQPCENLAEFVYSRNTLRCMRQAKRPSGMASLLRGAAVIEAVLCSPSLRHSAARVCALSIDHQLQRHTPCTDTVHSTSTDAAASANAATDARLQPGDVQSCELSAAVSACNAQLRQLPVSEHVLVLQWFAREDLVESLTQLLLDLDTLLYLLNGQTVRLRLVSLFIWFYDKGLAFGTALRTKLVERALALTENPTQAAAKCDMLGQFFSELGWWTSCVTLFAHALELVQNQPDPHVNVAALLVRKAAALRDCFSFEQAEDCFSQAEARLTATSQPPVVLVWSERIKMELERCNYAQAWDLCVKVLRQGLGGLTSAQVVTMLCRCAAVASAKRKWTVAKKLIEAVTVLSAKLWGPNHPNHAEAIEARARCLLVEDHTASASLMYRRAGQLRDMVYGCMSAHKAQLYEDYSYCLYVEHYTDGLFEEAIVVVEASLQIRNVLLTPHHVQLCSSNRVKALIMEEMAVYTDPPNPRLLDAALKLHKEGFQVSVQVFGPRSLTTAKYYGNLGRLYQTMQRFAESEANHRKAIEIKEQLLGPTDFEVAFSLGHLASLLNYDLAQYAEAELLYYRSIAIGLELFGPAYSGLEFDYRGLMNCYTFLGKHAEYIEMEQRHNEWQRLREEFKASVGLPPGVTMDAEQVSQATTIAEMIMLAPEALDATAQVTVGHDAAVSSAS